MPPPRYRRASARASCLLKCMRSEPGLRLRRVLTPMKTLPHGVLRFFLALPPSGWSQGFVASARVVGRMLRCREIPALPKTRLACSALLTTPTVARQPLDTYRCSPT